MLRLLPAMALCACLVACSDDTDGAGSASDAGLSAMVGVARLGPAGGEVHGADMAASVKLPSGALSSRVVISVGEVTETLTALPDGLAMASRPQAFRPHGLQLDKPALVTLAFTSSKLGKQVLRLDDEQDESWEALPDVQFERGFVSFEVNGFSVFVVAHPEDSDPLACNPQQTACDGRCVNLQRNAQNCGACRVRCGDAESCEAGVCRSTADAGPAPACVTDADCADSVFCNGAEQCVAAVCVAGGPPDCNDADPGTLDSCDSALDACRNQDLDDAGTP